MVRPVIEARNEQTTTHLAKKDVASAADITQSQGSRSYSNRSGQAPGRCADAPRGRLLLLFKHRFEPQVTKVILAPNGEAGFYSRSSIGLSRR